MGNWVLKIGMEAVQIVSQKQPIGGPTLVENARFDTAILRQWSDILERCRSLLNIRKRCARSS
jgi:hypothetical protein